MDLTVIDDKGQPKATLTASDALAVLRVAVGQAVTPNCP